MKKLIFATLLACCFYVSSLAQTVAEETTLVPAGKKLGIFSAFGVKSVINGGGAGGGGQVIPIIEFADIVNDGFIIRKEYKFTKYNENFEKEWEQEIDGVYGLQAHPTAHTLGKSKCGIYFLQKRSNPSFSELHITRFNEKGDIIQTVFKTENKYDDVIHSYVTDKGLNVIAYKINKKEKNVAYFLITFASANLTPEEKTLAIDYTEYEARKHISYNFLKEKEDRVILAKSYFKDIEGSKLKEPVIKTLEIKNNGELVNERDYDFKADEKTIFSEARLELDAKSNELIVFGYMNINGSKEIVDGLYLYRYNYLNSKNIYSNQISFEAIIKKSGSEEIRTKLKIVGDYVVYSAQYIYNNSYYYDELNGTLRLFVYNHVGGGMLQNKVTVNSIFFNRSGKVIEVDKVSYPDNILTHSNYRLAPKAVSQLWKGGEVQKTAPIDFINSFAGKEEDPYLWTICPRADYDILISVKESNSEIKVYKIKR